MVPLSLSYVSASKTFFFNGLKLFVQNKEINVIYIY